MWQWILTIYCDGKNHPCAASYRGEFVGEQKAYCIKAAREAGWSYGKKTLCPLCNPRNKEKRTQ